MSNNITKFDKNFIIEETISKEGMKFFNIENPPFKIYGLIKDNGCFRRMPDSAANEVSDAVKGLNSHAAGGRIRFKTNSKRISLIAKFASVGKMPHFAFTGSIGFDLYVKNEDGYCYRNTFKPAYDITNNLEGDIWFNDAEMRDITINFPTYSSVCEVYIGITEDATIDYGDTYINDKPIVFYGSSITQGGCSSRPGNIYQNIISRKFDVDYVNLGFSGSAKGEDEMIDYLKTLPMSIFVYDYDHNAPDAEHLEKTHKKLFKAVRENNPDMPIIIMTRPYYLMRNDDARMLVIKKTYENALNNGDKNVYYLDGPTLMSIAKNEGTVDDCHPNDLGFYSMAMAVSEVLKNIL